MTQHKKNLPSKFDRTLFTQNIGMTFIELVITLCIFTILASLALPSFQRWRQEYEANQLFNKVTPALHFARSSALTYHVAISVCGGLPSGCTGKWNDGMLVFTDLNHNGKIDSPHDHVLLYTPVELHYGNLMWHGAGGRPHIIFQESGLPLGSNGSLLYCGAEPQYHRSVVLSMMGHTRPSPDTNHDGIYEDTNGKPFVC